MRLVQLVDSLNTGGAQALLVTFAETVKPRGIDLTVISLRQDTQQAVGRALAELGVRLLTFPAPRLLTPQRLASLRRQLAQERFDLLHSHLTYAVILSGLITPGLGLPVVASLHNVRPDKPRWHPIYWLETLALRRARRVVAVGQVVAEANRARLGGRHLDVIVNAVRPGVTLTPAERTALRAEVSGDPERPLLLAVGRLSPQKAYPDLLRAFQILRTTHPAAALAIAGPGELGAELQAQIEREGLTGHARLLGQRTDVPRLLAASDIYVIASHWEGLPVAVLEAMAAGRPMVATAVGDVPTVLVPGTGLMVPPARPDLFAAAVRGLLDDPAAGRALGLAAQQHVARQYAPAVWTEHMLAVYSAAMGRPGGAA